MNPPSPVADRSSETTSPLRSPPANPFQPPGSVLGASTTPGTQPPHPLPPNPGSPNHSITSYTGAGVTGSTERKISKDQVAGESVSFMETSSPGTPSAPPLHPHPPAPTPSPAPSAASSNLTTSTSSTSLSPVSSVGGNHTHGHHSVAGQNRTSFLPPSPQSPDSFSSSHSGGGHHHPLPNPPTTPHHHTPTRVSGRLLPPIPGTSPVSSSGPGASVAGSTTPTVSTNTGVTSPTTAGTGESTPPATSPTGGAAQQGKMALVSSQQQQQAFVSPSGAAPVGGSTNSTMTSPTTATMNGVGNSGGAAGGSAPVPIPLSRSTSNASTSSFASSAAGGGSVLSSSRSKRYRIAASAIAGGTSDANSAGGSSAGLSSGLITGLASGFPAPGTAYSLASSTGSQGPFANANANVFMDEIKRWSMTDVSNWLSSHKLGNYIQTFVSNDITGAVLLDVDQSALKEMGIGSVGDRIRVYNAIKNLKKKCAEDAVMRRMSIVSASSTGTMLSGNGLPASLGSVAGQAISGAPSIHGLAASTSAAPAGLAAPAPLPQLSTNVNGGGGMRSGGSVSSSGAPSARSSVMGSHITIGGAMNSAGSSIASSSSASSSGGPTTSFLHHLQQQHQQQQQQYGSHIQIRGQQDGVAGDGGEMEVLDTQEYDRHPYATHPYSNPSVVGSEDGAAEDVGAQAGVQQQGAGGITSSNSFGSSSSSSSGVGVGTPVSNRRLAQSRPPPLHLTKSAANAPGLNAAQAAAAGGARPMGIGSNGRGVGGNARSPTAYTSQQQHRKVASASDAAAGVVGPQTKAIAVITANRDQQGARPGTGPGGLSGAGALPQGGALARPSTSSGVLPSHPLSLRPGGVTPSSNTSFQQQQQKRGSSVSSSGSAGIGLGVSSISEQPRTPTSAMEHYSRSPLPLPPGTPGTPHSANLTMSQQQAQYAMSQKAGSSSGSELVSPLSLEDLKRRTMKFIGDDGASRIVTVSDCKDAWEVLARVLKKFGKPAAGNSYTRNADSLASPMESDGIHDGSLWRIAATSSSGETKLLDDDELLAICQSPQVDDPLRERGLRLMRINDLLDDADAADAINTNNSSSSSSSRRPFKASRSKLEAFFGERMPGAPASKLEAFFGERVPPATVTKSPTLGGDDDESLGSVTTNGKKVNRASTANILHALGAGQASPGPVAGPRPPAAKKGERGPTGIIPRRARNFFGQRPPSELISSHLQDYFPATEKRVLERTARRSIYGKSLYRAGSTRSKRDSTYSFVPDADAPPLPGKEDEPEMPIIHIDARSAQSANVDSPPTLPPVVSRNSLDDWSANLHALGSPVPEVPSGPTARSTPSSVPRPASIRRRSAESSRSRKSLVSLRMRAGGSSSGPAGGSSEVDKSDTASLLTVDEITQEVENRRDSVQVSRPGSIRPSSPRSMLAITDEEDTDDGEGNSSPNIAERRDIFSAYDHSAGPSTTDDGASIHGTSSSTAPTSELRSDLVESGDEEDDLDFEDELTDSDYDEEDEDFEEPGEERIKWIKGALIGAGSFGNVFLGMNQRTGIIMAVKQVELPKGESHSDKRKKGMLEALEREIELLKTLQHPNIVQYLDSYADDSHLNIFLEYVPGGSVAALLNNYGALQEGLVRKFTKQILEGLSFLHAKDIVHRDIKGANILVDTASRVKISDFGISKKVESSAHRPSLQGSVFWMAPEVVKQTSYTRKADIWSLGCLVVEMISGTHPWANLNQMQALFKIGSSAKPTLPDQISAHAVDFLNKTFEIDHTKRPDADELLKHPFITANFVEDESAGGLPGASLSGTTLQSGASSGHTSTGKARGKGAGRKNKANAEHQQQASDVPPKPPSKS